MENMKNEELLALYRSGKEEAGNELYIRNEGLINDVLKVFKNFKAIDYEDKVNACNFGFAKAIKYYDDNSNTKFSSFCYKVMYNEITKELEHVSRKKRNKSGYQFLSVDVDYKNDHTLTNFLDIVDTTENDVLKHKDYTYIYDAIDYAMGMVMDKYHPYLLPLLNRELEVQQVADKTGFTVYAIRFTFSEFRRHAREYIYKYTSGESECLENKKG